MIGFHKVVLPTHWPAFAEKDSIIRMGCFNLKGVSRGTILQIIVIIILLIIIVTTIIIMTI